MTESSEETRLAARLDVLDEARFRLRDVAALVIITVVCLLGSAAVLVGAVDVGICGFVLSWMLGFLVVASDWRHRMKNWSIRKLEDELADLKDDWRKP